MNLLCHLALVNKLQLMNIYVSRNGETFGPYSAEQAKQFLEAGQLLATDYALYEGQTLPKNIPGSLRHFHQSNVNVLLNGKILFSLIAGLLNKRNPCD